MIRRELDGEDWLITQDDHGILAGVCASHLGNREFARPFDVPAFNWHAPARRLPARTYPDNASFRAAYHAAPKATLTVKVRGCNE